MTPIPEGHPLRRFFAGSVEDAFYSQLGLCAPDVVEYLTNLLVAFVHVRDIYPLKSAGGDALTAVSEMVAQTHFTDDLPEPQRKLRIHRHVGDYTLYWTGVYPESIQQHCRKGRRDYLVDFFAQGKRSYAIAAELCPSEESELGLTLERLSAHFEDCAHGLTLARHNWDGRPQE